MPTSVRPWTPAETKILKENYACLLVSETAKLLGRSTASVQQHASKLDLSHPSAPQLEPWTVEQENLLLRLYPTATKSEMRRALNKSDSAIYHRANRLGLSRSVYDFPRRRWTEESDLILEVMYPKAPKAEILKALPHFSWTAILAHAHLLGIYRDKRTHYAIVTKKLLDFRGPTRIESEVFQALIECGLSPVQQYLVYDRWYIDVALPKHHIAIQCDGDYWHGHPSARKNGVSDHIQDRVMGLDRAQNAYFAQRAEWKLLRFWEHEIKNDLHACVEQVLRLTADD